MLMFSSRLVLLTSLMVALTACGDDSKPASGSSNGSDDNIQWISSGGSCEEMEILRNDKEMRENAGFMLCGNAGRTFTGELRCERDFMEVQCR